MQEDIILSVMKLVEHVTIKVYKADIEKRIRLFLDN